MAQPRERRVAIVQRTLPHYRRPFFELLRARLAGERVTLRLVHGEPSGESAEKLDTVTCEWADRIDNKTLRVGRHELCWQPCLRLLAGQDLIVVEQATGLLLNYLLLARYRLGGAGLALWGHGRNFQARSTRTVAERVKRHVSRQVHWWFAYNDASAAVVRALGFPADRITSVDNAIDTQSLVDARRAQTPADVRALAARLGLTGRNVALYVGGMYADKRLPFLIEACELVRASVPDFEMLFIGSGPDARLVEAAAARHAWLRYLGPRLGTDRVPFFALSKLLLMPGLVGLAVLDAFALEVPMVTCAVPFHSPEIDYLVDEVNGVVVRDADSAAAYAAAVAALLGDEGRRRRLIDGCRTAAARYTVENMVHRFAGGVVRALAAVR